MSCIALPGWSYTDFYKKKKHTQKNPKKLEEGRRLRARENKGRVGVRESQASKKEERNETVLYARLDVMMMGTLRI